MNLKNDTNNKYNIKLEENISMVLKKVSDSVAIVFVICEIENEKLNIPDRLIIYDNTNNKILNKCGKQYFILCWSDSYTISYNNEIIIEMVSKHSWDLNVPVGNNRQIIVI